MVISITLFVLLPFSQSQLQFENKIMQKGDAKVTFIWDNSEKGPKEKGLIISLRPSGELKDLKGHSISDGHLAWLLGNSPHKNSKGQTIVIFAIYNPNATSVGDLIGALNRIRSKASKNKKTIVYIWPNEALE